MSLPLSKGRMDFPSCGKPIVLCWRGIRLVRNYWHTITPCSKHSLSFLRSAASADRRASGTEECQKSFLLLSHYLFCFHLSFLSSPLFFSFFLKFIYFNWRIITLQHCDDFCHTSVWIGHRYTCAPLSWTPSHCSPHPTPPGCHRAAALGALLHTPNLQWLSILILHVSILCSHGKP